MLAEIYGWFTEGFDTADLKDAKSLLDQWGVDGDASARSDRKLKTAGRTAHRAAPLSTLPASTQVRPPGNLRGRRRMEVFSAFIPLRTYCSRTTCRRRDRLCTAVALGAAAVAARPRRCGRLAEQESG